MSALATLPEYEAVVNSAAPDSSSTPASISDATYSPPQNPITTNIVQAPELTAHATINDASCYGGGGVRVPCTREEKRKLDDLVLNACRTKFGMPITWYTLEVIGHRKKWQFDATALYLSATSQLDLLLPLLQPDHLPTVTSLRTITLRLPELPPVDKVYAQRHISSSLRIEGRGELANALKDWFMKTGPKGLSLWAVADAIVERITMEGFIVYEEYWNVSYQLVQFVVRA